jgi:hypothetical protein
MTATNRGRRRSFDAHKKADFRELVQQGASLEEAARAFDVSLRTVQRERRLDKDFDRRLRLAQCAAVNPLTLLQQAARTHWRAAAWLLERTDPEQYAPRRPNSASPNQVKAALSAVIEAALTATPLETRGELYDCVQAAADNALRSIFPEHRPGEQHDAGPLTPLLEHERFKRRADSAPHLQLFDNDYFSETPAAPRHTPDSSVLKMGLTSRTGAKNIEILDSNERACPNFQQADSDSRWAPLDMQESDARRAAIARRALERLKRVKRSFEAQLEACSAPAEQNRDAIDAAHPPPVASG